jgi:DMSO/TMAO reductase YedYZ heme-binding membrane subunit
MAQRRIEAETDVLAAGGAIRSRPQRSPIILRSRGWEWALALALYTAFFLFMWEYHRWRGKPYTLFSANKGLAIAACLLFCIALSLGPLHRLTGGLRRALRLRRALGLTGAFFMIVHVVFSIFVVERFDLAYFIEKWPSWIFGAGALIGFAILWATSYHWALEKYGPEGWKRMHSIGFLFLALIAAHIVSLGKVPNWIAWFETYNQPVPPGTMIPSTAVVLTLLLRGLDRLAGNRGE